MAVAGAPRQASQRQPSLGVEQVFLGGTGRKRWLKTVGLDPTVLEERVGATRSPAWNQASIWLCPWMPAPQGGLSKKLPALSSTSSALTPTAWTLMMTPRCCLGKGRHLGLQTHAGTSLNSGAFPMRLFGTK